MQVGDSVWAYDEGTRQTALRPVTRLYRYERDTVYMLRAAGGAALAATSDHPFYVGGRWVRAGLLRVGDSLVRQGGQRLRLGGVRVVPGRVRVYNFTVAGLHTYFVGADAVLVHNSGPCPTGGGVSSAKNNANLGRLNKQLASEAQLGEKGKVIAGGAGKPALRKAAQLAQDNGGNALDYVKMGSTSYTPTSPTGQAQKPFEIHWEQNTVTGQRLNVKTVINMKQKP